jgi:CoA:oxalate CoA-transferase
VPGNPIKMSATEQESYSSPPLLGAHTLDVFRQWTDVSEARLAEGLKAGYLGSTN